MNDPIIDEIHRYREEYAARFNFDVSAMFQDAKEREEANKKNGRVIVPAPAMPIIPIEPSAPSIDGLPPRQAAA